MERQPDLDIPPAWEQATANVGPGVLLVIGGLDAGKSTFARYLYDRVSSGTLRPAFLDGDPGQTTLGPPATMTIALAHGQSAGYPPNGLCWRWFVGATTPRGHMLEVVTGAARLAEAARAKGAQTIIYDTSGLVDPRTGGRTLKLAKIDLLQPSVIFALQRDAELEALLGPLRLSRRAEIVELKPSPRVRHRSVAARRQHRAGQFRRYFASARPLDVDPRRLAVFPAPVWGPSPGRRAFHRLIALEDRAGFVRGLAIIVDPKASDDRLTLLTPLSDLREITTLRVGDLLVDPSTWHDRPAYGRDPDAPG